MGLGGSKGAKDLGASEAMAVATASLQLLSSHNTLLHTSPDYRYEADYGPGGAALRALVDWYDYSDKRVAAFKAANGRDTLLSGLGSALLEMRWGPAGGGGGAPAADGAQADAKWLACGESWLRLASEVQLGKRSWQSHRMDLVDLRASRAAALALDRLDDARRLFRGSPEGAFFALWGGGGGPAEAEGGAAGGGSESGCTGSDSGSGRSGPASSGPSGSGSGSGSGGGASGPERRQQAKEALAAHCKHVSQYMAHWQMECGWSGGSFELMAYATGTLLSEGDGAAAVSWLPSPAALLELAAEERAWDVFMSGKGHPSLACACVAAQLGRPRSTWKAAPPRHRLTTLALLTAAPATRGPRVPWRALATAAQHMLHRGLAPLGPPSQVGGGAAGGGRSA